MTPTSTGPVQDSPPWSAVILAGGAGRRLGGRDKPAIVVDGRSLLDRAVDASAAADEIVVVGPRRSTSRPVRWTREDPAGGGPLAALDAGLAASTTTDGIVVVLAADLPAITAGTVTRLVTTLAAAPRADGVVATDDSGRVQPLVGAYRRASIHAAMATVEDPYGRAFRVLLPRLNLHTVPDTTGTYDIDTPDDLARWRVTVEADRTDRHGV